MTEDEKAGAAKKMSSSETSSEGKKKKESEETTLSEEDLELQQHLDSLVGTAIGEPKFETAPLPTQGQRRSAIEELRKEVRMASATVAAIPKALKFLGRHYARLKHGYVKEKEAKGVVTESSLTEKDVRMFADVLSVVAMAYSDAGEEACESLKFRLEGSANAEGDLPTKDKLIDLDPWGQEYARSLMGEVTRAWHSLEDREKGKRDEVAAKDADAPSAVEYQKVVDRSSLEHLVDSIVPFQLKHSCEPDAVDLLLEVEHLEKLGQHIDEHNYGRVCLYLLSSCHFLPPPEDRMVLECAYKLYTQVKQYPDASIVAIKLNDVGKLRESFKACDGLKEDAFVLKCQIAYVAVGANHGADLTEVIEEMEDSDAKETLEEIVSNSRLSEHFINVARDLDVVEAKTPEDVFKQHLVESRGAGAIDTARQHLANAFVNGFVNAGFCKDKLVCDPEEDASANMSKSNLIFKNKDHGKISATASIGLISLWDIDGGLPMVDKYLYSKDTNILAGALLAVGVTCAGTQSDCDPALALLAEHLSFEEGDVAPGTMATRIAAIMGLGLAYAGNPRPAVTELLVPIITDDTHNSEIIGAAGLSLGLIHAGTANDDAIQTLLQVLMMRGSELPAHKLGARFLCIGLGLLFVGKGDEVDAVLEVIKTFDKDVSQYCTVVVETMAYAGTGNVLKVQQMLAMVSELCQPPEKANPGEKESSSEKEDNKKKDQCDGETNFVSVLAVALIALAEDVGMEMAHRNLEHILQYGNKSARKAVPLAYALLHMSDPEVALLDTLGRLTHDSEMEVAHNAILALGLMGAGTNHARIASMLRALSGFYCKDSQSLFIVRCSQGLLHLGKGLMTLAPGRADKTLLSQVALSCIASFMFICSDMKESILGSGHYLLYLLVPAIRPRFVVTLKKEEDNDKLKHQPVSCHVGTAVDVVGQAGKPKNITGFQTHNSPVLLGVGERMELATEKYVSMSPVNEGFVVIKDNPDYQE
ncbi:regulatory subunit of 26S proteasome [Chloropicon primus]|uniref:26S proteasome non-ATPase regulatory subunit 2 homolog n=1 Tax=Chloropicon primus TaxID=1764295 RepID=A0A5B8MDG9_9CHLO|nr:regulatory subunit of 26S proteasome [Chloropicon primus]UPQ97502.1 regulatory subunit of 26S proteasome [Chloropicon primus]|mmetsp:Transcript_1596/g.4535  ORF Transcript_1596/g.4535 Transcript_1596/m.4535 type:complete len:986 (+) Transcript_1596:92-3049(+)|eukprot:QDZ18291.1 regulatory subunit of 26S proteasome [Chloropicon primus]